MSLTMLKPYCELFLFCLTILVVVNFSQGNQEIVYIQAANTSLMKDPVKEFHFANFRKHNKKSLSVKPLQVLMVKREKLCVVKCIANDQCVSFNLAVKPDNEGKLRCELLATDMFNSSTLFVNDTDFLHFSIKSSCFPIPCKNDGICIPFYTNDTHKCNCTHPYYGERCEKAKCDLPLGLEDGRIKDSQMTEFLPNTAHPARLGRLNHRTHWTPYFTNVDEYLQIDLLKKTKVTKIATQGGIPSNGKYPRVTKYKVRYSDDRRTWSYYPGPTFRILEANRKQNTLVTNTLRFPIEARHIRIIVDWFEDGIAMRLELYGCELP